MRSKPVLICTAILAITFLSYENRPQSGHEPGQWHFSFSEVRAYRLNWDHEEASVGITSQDGSLNPTRIPEAGIRLTAMQVKRLEAAVTGKHPSHRVAMCFYPHHAFVFFDTNGKIVGHIDVCFLCQNYSAEPHGYAHYWDLNELRKLFRELEIPLTNSNWT